MPIVAQICFGLMSSNLAVVCSFNILLALAQLAVMLTSSAAETACELEMQNFSIIFLVSNTAVALLALLGVARWIEVEARRKIDDFLHSSAHSAGKSLLRNLCDVVIELDSELRIVDGAAKLATVLLRSSHTSLSGVYFHTVMSSEDSERFVRQLQAPSPEGEHACHAIHVNMRDSCGNSMKMELFTVEFEMLDECPHYFVGVREFTDDSTVRHDVVAEDAGPEVVREDARAASAIPAATHRRSRNRRLQGLGTPAASAREDLGSDVASQVSVASGSSGLSSLEACSLIHANYLPTTIHGRTCVLLKALASCNIPYRTLTCCRFHCSVEDARETLNVFRRLPCHETEPMGEWQCQHCGIINPDALMHDGTCMNCHEFDTKTRATGIRTSL
eukprot:TRINITY_DN20741_c0_g1_i1.p1 TRINITY_DN20741_c0_g1~~TRINITY_DN20741_c0_g1_i1.p1  ORF type:complete len:390 (+),score=51.03 TRINITY_DN20741_c0_g1_i1:532-1701(+)